MVPLSLSIWISMVGPVCVLAVLFRGRPMFVQYPNLFGYILLFFGCCPRSWMECLR
jgi:hypothetical protein